MRVRLQVFLVDDTAASLDPSEIASRGGEAAATAHHAPLADLRRLVVDGDPPAASLAPEQGLRDADAQVKDMQLERRASPQVLAHLSRTFWRLLDGECPHPHVPRSYVMAEILREIAPRSR